MSELKPVAQVAFELRTNCLKGQWESDELNDTDFFRAMCGEYEDYIPALQQRITELEKRIKNAIDDINATDYCVLRTSRPIELRKVLERIKFILTEAPKGEE